MKTNVKAVIFDCDGTLVESEELALGVLVQSALSLGLAHDAALELGMMRGEAMSVCISFVDERIKCPLPAEFEAIVRERMAHAFRAHLKPMPGARQVVERLQLPACVATNGPRSRAELTLGITGMLPYFEGRIYSAPDVGFYKPDPGLFLFAAASLNVLPHECAVVEDSSPGMRAGLAAGMRVYTVRSAHSISADLAGRVHVLDRFEDLLDQVASNQR
ncbi:HAD superfamily hydrolase (TIGR01509 family) [Pseudomonas sp. F-14 TE3623]